MPENLFIVKENSFENEPTLKLLSNEVQEIILYKPNWIVRNGIVLFLIIIGTLIACTFFISYPDIIIANAKLTCINAPKAIKIKVAGKLIKLNAIEGKYVMQNQLLGFMESTANPYEVIALSQITDTLQQIVNGNKYEIIPSYFVHPFENLGEVQQVYQNFMQSFILFKQYLSKGYYLKKKAMLQQDMQYLQKLHDNLLQQRDMDNEDLALAKETFEANKVLKDDKVIAPLDYRNEKSKYISKGMSIPLITASIISNESNQHDKQKEILQLENDISQQKAIFMQALNTLKAQLDAWKAKYLLIAPIDGKISFANFYQENQQLLENQIICFVSPENINYYAEVYIPQNNFGKIKQGQKTLLKLSSYPFQEFGAIKGELTFVSDISTDSGYLGKIILLEGLQTSYKKYIQYREGLQGQCEIITDEAKLSDRLLYQFKALINKH